MRAPWVRNHSVYYSLRTNAGFRLDPILLFFCQSTTFSNLCLWLKHTRHSGKTHLNMCELETSGNYSDLPSLKNPRNGDWENCHSPLDRTIPQKWTFSLWRWCWHPTVSRHQDEFPLPVFSSQSVFRETMITKARNNYIFIFNTQHWASLRGINSLTS